MLRLRPIDIIVLLLVLDFLTTYIIAKDKNTAEKIEEKRKERKRKKHRSTSSSSREIKDHDGFRSRESLDTSMTLSSTDLEKKKKYEPKSSAERRGWRKWHRKCPRCPEDMVKKWRDPSIRWICGAYQRARRSFKSLCMMHYRNCQDGTMFVKIHDHRCSENNTVNGKLHGDHFFYEYKTKLSDDSTETSEISTSSAEDDSTSSSS